MSLDPLQIPFRTPGTGDPANDINAIVAYLGRIRDILNGTTTTPVTPPGSTTDSVAPVVTFLSPSSGAPLQKDVAITLEAQATDNVAVTKLEFYTGAGALIGTGSKNGTTYSLAFTPTVAGALQLQARAFDAAGLIGVATISVTVQTAAVVTYTQTYTTTSSDFTAKCGAGTYGSSVQKTASSTISDADALNKAKAAAIAEIVCPVPQASFDQTFSFAASTEASAAGVGGFVNAPNGTIKFRFNGIANRLGTPSDMTINVGGNTQMVVTFPSDYSGAFEFTALNGTVYNGSFTNGIVNF